MGKYQFTCPTCSGHSLQQVQEIHVLWEVANILEGTNGDLAFEYGAELGLHGELAEHVCFKCGGCGEYFDKQYDLKPHCRPFRDEARNVVVANDANNVEPKMDENNEGGDENEDDGLDEEARNQEIQKIQLSIDSEMAHGYDANTLCSREELEGLKSTRKKIDAKYKPLSVVGGIQVKTSDITTQGAYVLKLTRSLVRRILDLRTLSAMHELSDIREFNEQSTYWYETNTETLRRSVEAGDDLFKLRNIPVECVELSVIGKHGFVFTACLKNVTDSIKTQTIYFEHPLFAKILTHFDLDLPALPEKD